MWFRGSETNFNFPAVYKFHPMVYNCSIFGCSTSRRHSGISIFKIPSGEDDLSRKTQEQWVNQITRNRVIDADLRRQINERKLHVCEKHFEEKFSEKRKYLLC